MPCHPQDKKFRKAVKVWLAEQELTVTALAARVKRRRDTVSTAINHGRFPLVKKQIAEVLRG